MNTYRIHYATRGIWDSTVIQAYSILEAIGIFYRTVGFYEITEIEPG